MQTPREPLATEVGDSLTNDVRFQGASSAIALRLSAALLAVAAVVIAVEGVRLALLGGSSYYAAAGLVLLAAAVLLWRRSISGAYVYAALLAATMVWALSEAGFDGWALAPRIDLPLLFGVWLLTPWARRGYGRPPLGGVGGRAWLVGGLAVIAAIVVASFGAARHSVPAATAAGVDAPTDWPAWGNSSAGTRYSQAGQLTPANVAGLKVAWTYETGASPHPRGAKTISFETTPLKLGKTLYFCSPHDIVYAVDAATGDLKWKFDPRIDETGVSYAACRGVAHHVSRTVPAEAPCAEQIFVGTVDARLIAIDGRTGRRCPNFGHHGEIDLKHDLGPTLPGYYFVSSPPIVSGNVVVTGAAIIDGQSIDEPSGVIRGFDVDSGRLVWAWDPAKPDHAGELEPGEIYTPGTPNSWSVSSSDDKLGLVYLPLGAPTPDYSGEHRTPAIERFANALVALDARTGKLRWSFQVVHHDLWDYDVASQPVLIDFPVGRARVPALITVSKSGETFVLDRATGRMLSRVEERSVPQDAAPGDRVSPTQPFSVDMPNFAGPPLSETRMWGITPFDQLWCRVAFRQARYDGRFTPPSLKGSIESPGFLGGVNWGSVSIDERRDLMIVNSSRQPSLARLISRQAADALGMHAAGRRGRTASIETLRGGAPQEGAIHAVLNGAFLSPLRVPCQQPPFGMLSAVDLRTRRLVWAKPIGLADRIGPLGYPSMIPLTIGLPTLGGSVTTNSGLTFIASTPDRRIRAYETATGRLLWVADLPANANATPMTYIAADGRQYLVIAAGGSAALAGNTRNVLVAFALPRKLSPMPNHAS